MLKASLAVTRQCPVRKWQILSCMSLQNLPARHTRPVSSIVKHHIADSHAGSSPSSSGNSYTVLSPKSRVKLHQVTGTTSEDVQRAVKTAYLAQPGWASTSIERRSEIVREAANLIKDRQSGWYDKLARSDREETSVSDFWADQQLNDVVQFMDTLADVAGDTLKSTKRVEGHHSVYTQRKPYGVCLAIAAWNAVHLLTSRAIITPLLAGNTVILKTSEYAPRTQLLWAELLFEAGLPRDCLTVLHSSKEDAGWVVPELIADSRVRHVNFTGSSGTGSIIASLAGKHLKPSIMELGGKAPALILPDADLDLAANHLLFGAWMNAGQVCMSTERILVPESQYDALVESLRKVWASVKGSKVSAPKVLCDIKAAEKVHDMIEDSIGKGAKEILSYDQVALASSDQWTVSPNIYGPITSDMRLYIEESFGPISAVIPVSGGKGADERATTDKMVDIANSSSYGLSASVWSRDVEKAMIVAKRLESGAVHINGPTCFDAPLTPHGGWKHSGWGRFNGPEGLLGFTQLRCITTPTTDPHALPLELLIP
ncbi:aldehyde dehydrogenase [Kockovaella imperatae]|uniref:Aldehyde dehydrogenase n=1 Tax=Kockovaella imperatae TaxID=4999 RepID=A0A1Y1U8D8_9TREE|nr:aldehyde dehydrogenase [Kockovaella imperatae]ORX33776.1 aldehyde dehydrogenase [Kockovaella imperatae]